MNQTAIETTKDIASLNLDMEPAPKIYEVEEIIGRVAFLMNISYDDILGDLRHRHVVEARHIAIFLIRETYPRMALTKLGKIFNRDHSTVIYALQNIINLCKTDKDFKKTFETVKNSL